MVSLSPSVVIDRYRATGPDWPAAARRQKGGYSTAAPPHEQKTGIGCVPSAEDGDEWKRNAFLQKNRLDDSVAPLRGGTGKC